MNDDEKIHFKDLSWPIKAAVIAMWVIGSAWALLFLSGMIGYFSG